MLDIIKDLEKEGGWNEMRRELGYNLGLDVSVSSAVLSRARSDDKFASHLFASSTNRKLLDLFLNDEKNLEYKTVKDQENHSNIELAKKAAKAVLKWGQSGFDKVSKETYAARINSCDNCEHSKEAPDQFAYKVKLKKESDPRICGACGCGISRKAWLQTETCPVADPSRLGFNLWGESIKNSPATSL